MFRKMRRTKQELTHEEVEKILNNCPTGILGVHGDNGYPYTVPVNFVYSDGAIYFHCAAEGHKIDAIKENEKVSFCVIAKDAVVPQEFATDYYSVIAFGRAKILDSREEVVNALKLLNKKLAPDFPVEGDKEIENSIKHVCVIKIEIEHVTGKAAIDGIRDTMNKG